MKGIQYIDLYSCVCWCITKLKNDRRINMKIKLNPDTEIVNIVKEGLKKTGGYCPCRLEKTDDTKCMCKEFKEQISNPNFEGFCHCMLYYKEK